MAPEPPARYQYEQLNLVPAVKKSSQRLDGHLKAIARLGIWRILGELLYFIEQGRSGKPDLRSEVRPDRCGFWKPHRSSLPLLLLKPSRPNTFYLIGQAAGTNYQLNGQLQLFGQLQGRYHFTSLVSDHPIKEYLYGVGLEVGLRKQF